MKNGTKYRQTEKFPKIENFSLTTNDTRGRKYFGKNGNKRWY